MKKCKHILIVALLLLIIISSCFAASYKLKNAMQLFAQTKGNVQLSLELQNALYGKLGESAREYITVSRDSSEHVTAIQIHSIPLSLLASELTVLLLEKIEHYENSTFGIPIGNLTSFALFSDRGPLIPVKPVASGNIASEIRSTLQGAGINQTLHRVTIHFIATIRYLAPLHHFTDTISFDLVIAETLVVGNVPIYKD